MGVLSLQTDLKSLKFGVPPAVDMPGGSISNQPYIKKPIFENPEDLHQNKDFILRGGANAPLDSATDVKRLFRYFSDLKSPSGMLFTAKQNVLSRTGVATQASGITDWKDAPLNEGIYTPLSTLAQAGINFMGGHIPKQGANPLKGVRTYSDVVRGDGIIDNSIVKIENNRLVNLYKTQIPNKDNNFTIENPVVLYSYKGGPNSNLGVGRTNIKFATDNKGAPLLSGIATKDYQSGLKYNRFSLTSPPTGVSDKWFDYTKLLDSISLPEISSDGGLTFNPGFQTSVYNIGTLTPRSNISTYQIGLKNSNTDRDTLPTFYSPLNNIGVSTAYETLSPTFPPSLFEGLNNDNNGKFGREFETSVYKPNPNNQEGQSLKNSDRVNDNNTLTWDQNDLAKQPKNPPIRDFKEPLLEGKTTSTIMGISPSYKPEDGLTIEGTDGSRIGMTSPGLKGNIINYTKGKILPGDTEAKPLDKINAQPLYISDTGVKSEGISKNDLVKFRIGALLRDGKTVYMHFRAFINNFSDSYGSNWSGIKYIGRGEEFFKYNGFSRKISLSYTVAAQSKPEIMAQYKKLNYLASTLAPDYGGKAGSGYMGGVLTKLTLGGWCYELPGFISSLNLKIPSESPWEIGINTKGESDHTVKEMPMICNVSMDFTPIHTFRPELQENGFDDTDSGIVNSYGDQRYIALSNGENTNYSPTSNLTSPNPNVNPLPSPTIPPSTSLLTNNGGLKGSLLNSLNKKGFNKPLLSDSQRNKLKKGFFSTL